MTPQFDLLQPPESPSLSAGEDLQPEDEEEEGEDLTEEEEELERESQGEESEDSDSSEDSAADNRMPPSAQEKELKAGIAVERTKVTRALERDGGINERVAKKALDKMEELMTTLGKETLKRLSAKDPPDPAQMEAWIVYTEGEEKFIEDSYAALTTAGMGVEPEPPPAAADNGQCQGQLQSEAQ